MTASTLTLKNLTRNRLRTTLTLVAIALPLFIFTVAGALVEGVQKALLDSDNNMRVAVHQKLSFTARLPQKVRDEILALAPEGYVRAICRTSWFGGKLADSQESFPNMGVDRDTFPIVYSEYQLTPDEIERFNSEKTGAIIAKSLADKMNWKLDDRVTLKSSIPPYLELEFRIIAVKSEIKSAPWLYFAFDYYDDAIRKELGDDESLGVNNFWLKCTSDEARQWALREIDAHFANSEDETRSEMESTFFSSFLKSGGDWVGMIWNIGQLIVLVAVAVAFNTMSMAFRERTREIAVLRALGFPSGRVTRMVLAEGLVLGLAGGVIAVAPIWLLASVGLTDLGFARLEISPQSAATALAVALAVGLLAALIPALQAGRLQVATALRKAA